MIPMPESTIDSPRIVLKRFTDPIAGITNHNLWTMSTELLMIQVAEAHHNHLVSNSGQLGCGPIDSDDPRAGLAAKDVGLESLGAVCVSNQHLLVDAKPGCIEKVRVDGDRSGIFGIALSHSAHVDLGEEGFS